MDAMTSPSSKLRLPTMVNLVAIRKVAARIVITISNAVMARTIGALFAIVACSRVKSILFAAQTLYMQLS